MYIENDYICHRKKEIKLIKEDIFMVLNPRYALCIIYIKVICL